MPWVKNVRVFEKEKRGERGRKCPCSAHQGQKMGKTSPQMPLNAPQIAKIGQKKPENASPSFQGLRRSSGAVFVMGAVCLATGLAGNGVSRERVDHCSNSHIFATLVGDGPDGWG